MTTERPWGKPELSRNLHTALYIDKINLFRYTKGFDISCMGEPGAEIYRDGVPGVFASPYHCGYVF